MTVVRDSRFSQSLGNSDAQSDFSEWIIRLFFKMLVHSPIHLPRRKGFHDSSPFHFSDLSSLSVILATVQSVISSFSFLMTSMESQSQAFARIERHPTSRINFVTSLCDTAV